MSFDTFFADILATLIGGIVLAVLFFWSAKKLYLYQKLQVDGISRFTQLKLLTSPTKE